MFKLPFHFFVIIAKGAGKALMYNKKPVVAVEVTP